MSGVNSVANHAAFSNSLVDAAFIMETSVAPAPDSNAKPLEVLAAAKPTAILFKMYKECQTITKPDSVPKFHPVYHGIMGRLDKASPSRVPRPGPSHVNPELQKPLALEYAETRLPILASSRYERDPTRHDVLFENPNGFRIRIQEGTEPYTLEPSVAARLEGESARNQGPNRVTSLDSTLYTLKRRRVDELDQTRRSQTGDGQEHAPNLAFQTLLPSQWNPFPSQHLSLPETSCQTPQPGLAYGQPQAGTTSFLGVSGYENVIPSLPMGSNFYHGPASYLPDFVNNLPLWPHQLGNPAPVIPWQDFIEEPVAIPPLFPDPSQGYASNFTPTANPATYVEAQTPDAYDQPYHAGSVIPPGSAGYGHLPLSLRPSDRQNQPHQLPGPTYPSAVVPTIRNSQMDGSGLAQRVCPDLLHDPLPYNTSHEETGSGKVPSDLNYATGQPLAASQSYNAQRPEGRRGKRGRTGRRG
jgi:hypothetical protein